jgi:acyl-CoA synthetase (AMP-forming)/AMP-acid ligase II
VLRGRIKDIIIRGGVNLSPLPLEECLAAHPGVRQVAVIGWPDDRLGERLCAVVVPAEATVHEADLMEWVAAQGLSRRQWPEVVRIVERMPMTPAGKIRKHVLRDELLEQAS